MFSREVSKTEKPSKESEDFAKLTALLKQALNGCLAEVWRQRSQVWQLCAAMMSWVWRWVELVVY